jgi:flagellar M-ring protein FliF
VPELTPGNVTVVDQAGNLLTEKPNNNTLRGLNASQLDYLREIESYYAERVEAIVSPIVGKDNVKAEVRADLDFSEVEATSESYKPNPPPDAQSIRSQQTVEDINNGGNAAQGIPGALTNQPPGPAAAPLNAPPGANAGPNVGPGGLQAGGSSRRESTINYELDKTVRHTKEPLGRIKRLSVAVVVNYKAGAKDAEGLATKPIPLTPVELQQINNLVRESMGFNQPRGDSVNVVNAAFTDSKSEQDTPLWKDPENVELAKTFLKNLLIFGLAFYLVFGVIRPFLRDMVKPPAPPESEESEEGEGLAGEHLPGEELGPPAVDSYAEILAKVREFAKTDPKVAADIVKEWMMKE